ERGLQLAEPIRWKAGPLHEPPLTRPSATLSPPGGERAGRGVPIWFMVPMHAKNERGLSMNRPSPHPSPPPRGERVPEGRVRGMVHGPNACAKAKGGSP